MSDEQITEFRQRWQNIRDDLAKVEIGNLDEIIAIIQLEKQRAFAKHTPPQSAPLPPTPKMDAEPLTADVVISGKTVPHVEPQAEPEFAFRPSGDGYYITGFGESGHFSASKAKGLHDLYRLVQAPRGEDGGILMLDLINGVGTERLAGDSRSPQPVADRQTFDDIDNAALALIADIEAIDSSAPDAAMEKGELERKLEELKIAKGKLLKRNGKPLDLNDPNRKLRPVIDGRIKTACKAMKKACVPCPELARHFGDTCSASGAKYVYAPANADMKWDTTAKR